MAAIAKVGAQPLESEHHLWPCNLPAWQAWQGVLTQWRVGASGATGLDYVAVRAYLRAVGVPAADQPGIFKGIQACEEATLKAWAELRDKK